MAENYILLERTELNASAASVTFANIPQSGYTDLKIVVSARGTTSGAYYYYAYPNGATTNLTGKYLYNADPNPLSGSGVAFGYMPPSTYTANTFSNDEIYFPNYLSGNFKSYSHDSISENNTSSPAPAWRNALAAGLWSQTTAISSVTITSAVDSFAANSTFSLYGIAALGTTPVIAPKASGGNIIDFDGTNWIHTFTTSGTFTPLQGLTCDYLVVAGGGGGGSSNAGGGGGGGLRSTVTATGGGGSLESAISVTTGTNYAITVGAGGTSANNARGGAGNDSIFSTITSTGGAGGGGSNSGQPPLTGGSGGGGTQSTNGSAGTSNQGFAGGNSVGVNNTGGGGGGAGAVGSASSGVNGGNGGNGVAVSITGSSVTYAGGGGGSSQNGSQGSAGSGGASAAQFDGAVNATTNTGGGAGGRNRPNGPAGNGGSGIVIIRYPAA